MRRQLITVLLGAALALPALADPPKVPLFGRHKQAIDPAPAAASPAVDAAPPAPAAPRPADTPITTVEVPPAAAAAAAPAAAAEVDAGGTVRTDLAHLRAAYAFALPVYEMMRTRYLQVTKTAALGAPGVNHLYARTTLADATTRDVTTPNNDTLYSSAWLDLAGGAGDPRRPGDPRPLPFGGADRPVHQQRRDCGNAVGGARAGVT